MTDIIAAILAVAGFALFAWGVVIVCQIAIYGPHCASIGGGC